MKAEKREGG